MEIEFYVFDNPQHLSVSQWLKSWTTVGGPERIVQEQEIRVAGFPGVKRTMAAAQWAAPWSAIVVYVASENKIYRIQGGPANSIYVPEFNQILQTFKFTQ